MVKEKEAFLITLMKITDGMIIAGAFILSYFIDGYLRPLLHLRELAFASSLDIYGAFYFLNRNILIFLSSILFWILTLSFLGVYNNFRTKRFLQVALTTIKAGVLATIVLGSVIFITKMTLTSRFFISLFFITSTLLLIFEKKLFMYFGKLVRKNGHNLINLLIVGTGRRAQEFIKVVKANSDWGLRIVGLIDDEEEKVGTTVMGYKVIGMLKDIPRILHEKVVDRVVFVVPRLWLNRIEEPILACETEGVSTCVSVDLYNLNIAKVHQTDFGGFPLLEFDTFRAKEWQLFIKRVIDILVSIIGLIISIPIFIIVSIIIKLTSPGPVLFKQERCGLNGRRFILYKFRSMHVGAEMRRRELERQNEMNGPVFKMKRDPRVTPFGRILRKFSIDELPQLINVLKGDMSIVGPRPPLPVEVEMYEVWQRRRLSLKPGITCIWQVSGRNKVDFEEWMNMDLKYIDNWSLWLDFKIMFKTIFVVLFGYGAY